MLKSVVLLFVIYFVSISCEKARFDNYRVYRVWIENQQQLELLQMLEGNQDGLTFFDLPIPSRNTAEIIVPPHKFADIVDLFEKYDIKSEIKISNLQRYFCLSKLLLLNKKNKNLNNHLV